MSIDLRSELKSRIDKLQSDVAQMLEERRIIEQKINQAELKLKVWRDAIQIEAEQQGEPPLPLFNNPNQPYRFAGMKLIDAVDLLRKEQPSITKKQARKILEQKQF